MIALTGTLLLPLLVTRPDVTVNRAALDLWELSRAERAYAEENEGYFDSIHCVRMPSDCIPGYDVRRTYLAEFGQGRWGYYVTYHPGPLASSDEQEGVSPSRVESFAITSVSMGETSNPYRPAFCLDARFRLWLYTEGMLPRVENGQCADVPGEGIAFEGRDHLEVGAVVGELRYRRTGPVSRLLVGFRVKDAASRLALALVLALTLLFMREKDFRVGAVLGTTAVLFFLPILVYAPVAWFLNAIVR